MKSLKEQILNKCRHFNGMQNKECKAGIAYEDVKTPGKGYAIPCWRDNAHEAKTCDKCDFFTEADADARIAYIAKRFEGTGKARAAIVAHLGGQWKRGMGGASGVIDCPACNGKETLRFSRAGCNGHIHAKCDTKDCVSWME